MGKIKEITAREILNSRGNPTIETTVTLDDGAKASASTPSGKSVSSHEAVELIDHDPNRFDGKGALTAVDNVQTIIAPALLGLDVTEQQRIDKIMIDLDSTPNKSKLGANAILSVSMAVARAGAASSHMPLFLYLRQFIKTDNLTLRIPTPLFNIINGGLHAGKNVDFQEFQVIPASSKPYDQAIQIGTHLYLLLKKALESNGMTTLVGDEGGFAPVFSSNNEVLVFLTKVIADSPFRLGLDVFLGLDVAANSFYTEHKYFLKDRAAPYSPKDLIEYYKTLEKAYHLLYLEDPFAEDDWDAWTALSNGGLESAIIVGDDLISTNPLRLQTAIEKKAVTGIIIKPNQIGSVIETLAVVELARASGLKIIVSHRSSETNDDFIADFAVGVSADYMKLGAPARGERVAKYNRLLYIQDQIKRM